MGAVLVDDHEARLDGGHHETSLVLVVGRRFLLYDALVGSRGHGVGKQGLRHGLGGTVETLVELLPLVGEARGVVFATRLTVNLARMRHRRGRGLEGIVLGVEVDLRKVGLPGRVEQGDIGLALGVELNGRRVVEHAYGILRGG